MRVGIIKCDRSILVDEGEERSAGIITAAIKSDRRAPDRSVAAQNLKGGIIGDVSAAGNVHVDRRATLSTRTDAAARVIDLSDQRIRSDACCVYVDFGNPADCASGVDDLNKGISYTR